MSSVIQFLEAAGRGLALSPARYAAAVAALDVDDAQRQALLDRDYIALNELLDGRAKVLCLITTPDQEHESNPDDSDGNGVPDDDESQLQA